METSGPHVPEDAVPETRDERTSAYEPPSVTGLGTFLDVTAGAAGGIEDTGTASIA
jgi:hypothetical protein